MTETTKALPTKDKVIPRPGIVFYDPGPDPKPQLLEYSRLLAVYCPVYADFPAFWEACAYLSFRALILAQDLHKIVTYEDRSEQEREVIQAMESRLDILAHSYGLHFGEITPHYFGFYEGTAP